MSQYAVQWYALRVRGKGNLAAEHATEAIQEVCGEEAWKYEIWNPQRSYAARTRSKSWFCKWTPVIPGHMFARIPADPQIWSEMCKSRAILGFLTVEAEDVISGDVYRRPACIPNKQIEYLMACDMVGDYDWFGRWLAARKAKDKERRERNKWKRGFDALAALNTTEAA